MANAKIDVLGPSDVGVIVDLYNQIFNPRQDVSFFNRRFAGRRNVSILMASIQKAAVGFNLGFELTPTTYYSWMCGVLPGYRRAGIATQLIEAQQAWSADQGYSTLRFECNNQHRAMLHVAINQGYDLVGIRWDTESGANVAIFEKSL